MKADCISIDTFAKVDLCIAKIIKVEDHPNADRLYVIEIDLGEEKRTIVAGIKNSYTPEELLGRQIVVVANLKKSIIRGIESNGMLLAGKSKDKLTLLSPSEDIDIGVRLS